jgi:hypothetical protein
VRDGGNTAGNLWSDSNSIWRPIFCVPSTSPQSKNPNTTVAQGYLPCPLFQVMPHWFNSCRSELAQGMHPSGMNIGRGDASVRLVRGSMSPTVWAAICDPRDGTGTADAN